MNHEGISGNALVQKWVVPVKNDKSKHITNFLQYEIINIIGNKTKHLYDLQSLFSTKIYML